MNPRQITALLIFGSAVVMAVCAGISIAMEDYMLLTVAACAVAFVLLIVTPGYIPLLVFGLLTPFALPLPFFINFPFLLFALGICVVKYWLERGLTAHKQFTPIRTLNLFYGLFFAWVFLRYCMQPSIPNLIGFGRNVTGFRAWLQYGLCFVVVFFTGRFVGNRQGLVKLMRWLAYTSVFFSVILLVAAFSRNIWVLAILSYFGMFVSWFDNGILRLVALSSFGLILLSLTLLPNLLKLKWYIRIGLAALAILAVFTGGNRSSLGGALIILVTIPLLRRKFFQSAATVGLVLAVVVGGYLAGPMLSHLPHIGFLRPLALVSPELAEATGGDNTLEWREERWQRAIEEIQNHPLIGRGYGGVEDAVEVTDKPEGEELDQEVSLATGGIHNGYLASALALGIPFALFFVYILTSQIVLSARGTYRFQREDPVISEAYCFICAHLIVYAAAIFVGTDTNAPIIWFYIALGAFLPMLRVHEHKYTKPAPSFAQPILATQSA